MTPLNIIRIVPAQGSLDAVRRYRRDHGCTLKEACDATGFRSTQIERIPAQLVPLAAAPEGDDDRGAS